MSTERLESPHIHPMDRDRHGRCTPNPLKSVSSQTGPAGQRDQSCTSRLKQDITSITNKEKSRVDIPMDLSRMPLSNLADIAAFVPFIKVEP